MALPGNVGHGTVTGRFVDNAGNALEGTVTFTASPRRLLNATASPPVTILPKPVTATLNDGAFTQALIATDDEDNNPHGWTYRVDFRFTAATAESFSFELPEGSTVDLTTVSPVGSGNGTTIIRGAGVPDWDSATNSQVLTIVSGEPTWADASGGGGGGAVDSVNGQTGTVTLTASDVGAQPAGSYATATALSDGLAGKSDNGHVHGASEVTSGTFNQARIPNDFPVLVYAPETERPTGSRPVMWVNYGTEPANAIEGDIWLQPAPVA